MSLRLSPRLLTAIFGLALLCLTSPAALATTVRMQTALGNIDIELMDAAAPATVANFLAYVNSGAYANSFIHRSAPGFVIQGGGYRWNNATGNVSSVPANAPVVNEYSAERSNLRGTIAMAKIGSDPNSATNQWFFNLADNSANLDNQNGGFTVFGKVVGNGMQVVDAIAALTRVNAGSPFDTLPLITVPTTGGITAQHLVIISAVTVLPSELNLVPGWNLVGNGVAAPFAVTDVFNDAAKIGTVWKWVTAGTTQGVSYPAWAFYTPAHDDGGRAYAANKGYDFLTTIDAGQGFWVHATTAVSASLPPAPAVLATSFKPTTGTRALPHGWSLIATGDAPTPARFAAAIAASTAATPATGQVHTSLTTLWAWDASRAGWVFWAPNLVNDGGLAGYLSNKGYLDFATLPGTPAGTLAPATGFWVNMP